MKDFSRSNSSRYLAHAARVAMACLATQAVPAAAGQGLEVREMCTCLVTSISDNGNAAAGLMNGSNQTVRWTADGGATPLGRGTVRALQNSAGLPAISGDGQVVAATILDESRQHGTQGRWTVTGGWQQLMPPRPADGAIVDNFDGSVFGMSRDGGTVTGLYWRNTAVGGMAHGSRWTVGGQVIDMGSSGASSRIDDANRDGSVLVGWDEDPVTGSRRAAVWVNGVRTVLDENPSEASAVNADGTVVVGTTLDLSGIFSVAAMWRWDGAGWVRQILGALPGTRPGGMAFANGVSDDGKVVVGLARMRFSPMNKGFVWTAETGVLEAARYFRLVYGRDNAVERKVAVTSIGAISGDGQSMGVVGTSLATGLQHSYIVKAPSAGR